MVFICPHPLMIRRLALQHHCCGQHACCFYWTLMASLRKSRWFHQFGFFNLFRRSQVPRCIAMNLCEKKNRCIHVHPCRMYSYILSLKIMSLCHCMYPYVVFASLMNEVMFTPITVMNPNSHLKSAKMLPATSDSKSGGHHQGHTKQDP